MRFDIKTVQGSIIGDDDYEEVDVDVDIDFSNDSDQKGGSI